MRKALIVGAGIGGLAAGLALRRAGWDIRIFERTASAREVGFGLGLMPNAVAALRDLGVAGTVIAQSITPVTGEIRRIDGRVLRRFAGRVEDLGPGEPPRIILRPALHGALLDALGPDAVAVNHAAVRFEKDGDRVRLHMADGTSVEGDILVGADGVASTIRGQLHPAEPPAKPSGYFAVRGVSRAIERLGRLQALFYFGRGVESALVQASPGAIYWYVSLLADDVRRGPIDVESVMRRSTADFDALFHAIVDATPPADMRLDELLVRDPITNWGAGRVTLLGDAAHPMLPYTGQGAAQAIEDAVGLGRAMRQDSDPVAALRRYEDVRSRRTRRVVASGPRIARVTTTRNPIVGLLRNAAIRFIPEFVLVRAVMQSGPDPNRELGER